MKYIGTIVCLAVLLGIASPVNSLRLKGFPQEDGVHCNDLIDLVMVLDESGSVGPYRWRETVIPFAERLLSVLNIGQDKVRTAMIKYSTYVRLAWDMSSVNNNNKEDLLTSVSALSNKYVQGTTNTGAALLEAKKALTGNGSRSEAHKLVVLVTDGVSNAGRAKPVDVSDELRKMGATVMVVGIVGGGSFSERECVAMAGCQKKDQCSMYQDTNWTNAVSMGASIMKVVCKAIATNSKCKIATTWSDCSAECGKGIETETVNITEVSGPTKGDDGVMGKTCAQLHPADAIKKTRSCEVKECVSDATCSEFGPWSSCSNACGEGTQERKREPFELKHKRGSGKTCEEQGLVPVETKQCKIAECPVDAVCAEVGEWSECSAKCGDGSRTRTRPAASVEAAHGGKTCEQQGLYASVEEKCNLAECPILGEWENWSDCSVACGGGVSKRTRTVTDTSGTDIHDENEPNEETQQCNLGACPAVVIDAGKQPNTDGGSNNGGSNNGGSNNGGSNNGGSNNGGSNNGGTNNGTKKEEEEKKDEPSGSGANTAAIAGGVIGGLALLGGAGAAAYHFLGSGASAAGSAASAGAETGIDASAEAFEASEEGIVVDVASDSWG